MLDIVGATYYEQCIEGSWNEYFGSGLRAAVSLKGYTDCVLHTYLSQGEADSAKLVASVHGVKLAIHERYDPIWFRYQHGLSVPSIYPAIQLIRPAPLIHVKADHSLRFGMLEGDAMISSDLAVYDPQSAYAPQPFRGNGSSANRLCVVCNRREAHLLTSTTDVNDAMLKIAITDQAEAVIVKCGSQGALVLDQQRQVHRVPAFRTPIVWPIGSGDVFAAWFAYAWAERGLNPLEAALLASKATAQYCASKSLGDLNPDDPSFPYLALPNPKPTTLKYDVYLAGPFFTISERWLIEETKIALESMGLKVFSPFHDVGVGSSAEIYPSDIEGLVQSYVVYAILDGCDPGTVYEIGYAASLGKPIVGFSQNETDEHLKMLKGTPTFTHFDDYVSSIYHAAWRSRE